MKKLFIIAILVLGLATCAYAEFSNTAYSSYPPYTDEQVFAYYYNDSGSSISSNMVVIIDTTAATMRDHKATGSIITTTTTAENLFAVGVTDEVISDGKAGKVCIRGPHRCLVTTTGGALVAGASLATTTTAGYLTPRITTKGGTVGTLISTAADFKTQEVDNGATIIVDNPNLYWVNIGQK